ncbi:hypothetical protein AAZX31_09G131300 [Glycine max]|uniref:protein PAM68, chloroplastic n=1 Tax=Glycine max TaxID=3847 RepID=UPI00023C882E|nr:protein PAM68, chloroplastic-like [Glycine max]XP_028247447.1 protein PAM68, chloroplastic-like [Glycine soja]KAG4388311.1 hypothetical protein GLYMA_09G144551v4 [Glycine max]KAH1233691.1 hypothetical protein GmHk_09G026077 [Glycine max]|eukprot:XP_014617268.1 protein PAM68, chloroplastic-like [Glycine max]
MVATAATFFNPLFLHTHGRVNIWALSRISYLSGNVKSRFPIYRSEIHHQVHYFSHLAPICATFKEPMGFGPAPKKRKKSKMRRDYDEEDDDEEQEEEEEPGELFLK